jgi:hypothetical protein
MKVVDANILAVLGILRALIAVSAVMMLGDKMKEVERV